MPSKEKTGGKVNYIPNKETMCLTEKQTDYVYKAIEEGNIINTKTTTCETMQNQDDNPYKKVILNKVFRKEDKPQKSETGPYLVTMSDMYNMDK